MNALVTQVLAVVRGWSPRRRLVFLGSAVAVVLAVAAVAVGSGAAVKTVLMSNLSTDDVSAVRARLESLGVSYDVAADGQTILVPERDVHQLRLALAAEGLPRGGGVGLELFDHAELGMSRFTEQVNYRRAVEGELRRTIMQLDVVREARVHLVLPERRLFTRGQDAARASVTLALQPGRSLAREQVQAVVHLVSSAVPDLSPDAVTLVDTRGNLLARPENSESVAEWGVERQVEMERRLALRAQEILERAVGVGNAAVTVRADMSFGRLEKTSELFDPEGVLRSEQVSEETKGTSEGTPEGVPGVRSNVAGRFEGEAGRTVAGAQSRRSQTKNYEVGKTVTREVKDQGVLERLSIAVLITMPPVEGAAPEASALSAEQVGELSDLVKRAVGFKASRGDELVLQARYAPPEPVLEPVSNPMWLRYVNQLWKAVAAFLALIILASVLLRMRRPQPLMQGAKTVRQLESQLGLGVLGQGDAANLRLTRRNVTVDPEVAGAVVKAWVNEP